MSKPIAFVTGAAGGLGQSIVSKLLNKGYIVLVNDYNQVDLKDFINKMNSADIEGFPFDITNEDNWKEASWRIEKNYGQLDVLINAAGMIEFQTIEKTSLELWTQTINVNATSVFLSLKYFSHLFREGSSIVNISSIASFLGSKERIAYAASKGAVSALTKAASIEFAHRGIRVNSVHPAYIKTQMADKAGKATERSLEEMGKRIPLYQRISTPDEVADIVLFLSSKASRFMTGAEVVVDGGQSVN